ISVREHLSWAYANLARAHSALNGGATRYSTVHHVVRARLYRGLLSGSMSIGSIFDDERIKLLKEPACTYCGSTSNLALDHLLPRSAGMSDRPDNLVLACRSCNSSKRDRDCIAWLHGSGRFPS